MANNFKRMQKLAGLITESQYRESINEMTEDEKYDLLYNFVDEKMVEGDRIAEKIISGKLPNKYDDLYAFVDDKMVEGDEDAKRLLRKINKAKANESQLNENKPYALLATVADDWGKDSDLYGDLEAAVIGWTDRNGELTPKGL